MEDRQETAQTEAADGVHDPVAQDEATTEHDETGHEVAVATPVDEIEAGDAPPPDDEEIGGGGNGRFITAIGAAVLLIGMFLSWYEVVRRNGYTVDTTGWQTFTKLRFLLLAGSVGCVASVLMRQTRAIVLGRLAVGLVASALVIRRIVSPPDLPGATLTAQLGIYVSLLGALGIAFGGLLGLGTEIDDEDADEADEGRPGEPVAALDPGSDEHEVVDADVVDEERADRDTSVGDVPSGVTR
jgi:hypothetical protein